MAIENVVTTAEVETRNDDTAGEWVCVNVNKVSNRAGEYIAVDIRKYVESENYDGYTKQGVSVSVEQAEELLAGLEAAIEAAKDAVIELENKPKAKRTRTAPSKKAATKKTTTSAKKAPAKKTGTKRAARSRG